MRPREIINKRKKLYLTLVAIGFAVLIVLAFIEKYIAADIFKWLLYAALAIFGLGNVLLYIGIRCPKCRSIIGFAIVFAGEKVHQCPRCKIILDEDIEDILE